MEMNFLPFPRGTTARGTSDGKVIVAKEFLNQKGQPILSVLKGESQLAQVLMGAEFINNAIYRCVLTRNPSAEKSWSIGKNLKRLAKLSAIEDEDFVALAAIRDIRNIISHADFAIDLTAEELQADLQTLDTWLKKEEHKWSAETADGRMIPGWIGELIQIGELTKDYSWRRAIFLGAIIMLYVGLANVQWALDSSSYTGETIM